MAVMAKSWTDERLEERFDRIDERFDRVDQRFDEIDGRFGEVNRRVDELDRRCEQRFDRLDVDFRELRSEMTARFDATQRLIVQIGGGMLATMVIGFAGLIATHV